MAKKIVFGKWEAICLLINVICTKIFLNFPRVMVEQAGTASWLLTVYISILALLFFFIITGLYSRFEGMDLMDIGEYAGGPTGRIIVGSIILIFLLYIVPVILREFTENIKIISLNVSPISFVLLIFLSGMIAGAYAGIEAIARYQAIAVPVIAVAYVFILVGGLPHSDINNIFPILGNGAYDIFVKGALKVSVFSELIFLFLIIPYIKTNKNSKTVGYISIGISAFFMITGALAFSTVFPYPTSLESFLPIYQLARLLDFGDFFQRIESVFVLIWGTSALLYLSTGFYFIVHVFQKTFKLAHYKPLILPFAIIVFILGIAPPNLVSAVDLETKYFRNTSWAVTFAMSAVLLIIARVVKRKTEIKKVKDG